MLIRIGSVVMKLFLSIALLTSLSATAWAHGKYCAVLFDEINYGGSKQIIWGLSGENSYIGEEWNDVMSSAVVGESCVLTIYQAANYGGEALEMKGGRWYYVSDKFNDTMSSYKCTCDN